MELKLMLEKLEKEIENLKNRKIRGEEQERIARDKMTSIVKNLLELTGTNTLDEAIEYARNLRENLSKKEDELKAKCKVFLQRAEAI